MDDTLTQQGVPIGFSAVQVQYYFTVQWLSYFDSSRNWGPKRGKLLMTAGILPFYCIKVTSLPLPLDVVSRIMKCLWEDYQADNTAPSTSFAGKDVVFMLD